MDGREGRKLRPQDHVFLNYERRGANTAMDFGLLLRVTAPPLRAADLRAFGAVRFAEIPELGLALARPTARWRHVAWQRVQPDLDHHVREIEVPRVSGWAGVRAAVERELAERLSRDRPLWRLLVIRGYSREEYCVLFRVHHALFDGPSLVEIGARLLGLPPSAVAPAATAEHPGYLRAFATLARGAPGYLSRFIPPAGRAFSTRSLSGGRRLSWASADRSRLHAVAKRHGATGNEVFLAALAGALRDWPHTPWRKGIRPVWAQVPFDTRAADGTVEPGNHVVSLRVRLPCDLQDPRARLAEISRASAKEKDLPATVMRVGARVLPSWLVRTMSSAITSRWHVDLLASNTGWLGNPLSHGGNTIGEALPVGFLLRKRPLGVILGTYGDNVVFHAVTDTGLPAADVLCQLWVRELDRLAALPALRGDQ